MFTSRPRYDVSNGDVSDNGRRLASDASRVAGLEAVREATRQRASDVAPVLDANRVQVVGQRRAELSNNKNKIIISNIT